MIGIRITIRCWFVLAAVLAAGIEASATVRRVPADFQSIQVAIDASVNGDVVLVSPGTYVENINFRGKAIAVMSEAGPAVTIIDGSQANSVVTFNSGEGPDSLLMGFTIRNGNALGTAGTNSRGGGISMDASSPTIKNNVVTDNRARFDGGGISAVGGAPSILENSITANGACGGAGINLRFSSAIIRKNIVDGNFQFGCIGGEGGGIGIGGQSAAQVLDNTISNNSYTTGAGISLFASGPALIRGNTIKGNNATINGVVISISNSSPAKIIQNLIVDNTGTAISWGSQPESLINNTIANNDGAFGSGIRAETFTFQGIPQLINNIIVAKPGQIAVLCDFTIPGSLTLRFNNVFSAQGSAYGGDCSDQTGVSGNISADPLFLNPISGNYHLLAPSPSIDTGDNSAPSLPVTDFDGNPRIQDGNGDAVAVVDMGAYESIPVAPPFNTCIQDDSSGGILSINTTTGDYQFTDCSGLVLNGKGRVSARGDLITLQDYSGNRRVLAKLETALGRGFASIQILSQGRVITLSDRITSNNACSCPG